MIATIDIADVGPGGALKMLARGPNTSGVRGLRWSNVAALAPLATMRPPRLGPMVRFACWDSEEAAAAGVESGALGTAFEDGFHAMLRPIRAFGSWPGLDADVPHQRAVPHAGPVVALTLGRLRLSQSVRFLRASRPAERAAATADGLLWGTASARPPFVATVSLWRDSDATRAYAYADPDAGHPRAITAQRRKDFHHESAFIRCAPITADGSVKGLRSLSASMLLGGATTATSP